MPRVSSRPVCTFLACLLPAIIGPAAAEEMPVRIYTIADGLVRDDVLCIRRDSRGYLWFGTAEGLSIFDGYQFTNYTVADGLPNRAVLDVLETRQGDYWIATYGGLCRFLLKPVSGSHFVPYRVTQGVFAQQVNRLIERRDGSVWIGTEGGLWRLKGGRDRFSADRVPLPSHEPDLLRIFSLMEDRRGTLWAATSDGLYAIDSRGGHRVEGLPDMFVLDVAEDAQGRIWASTTPAVCQIAQDQTSGYFVSRSIQSGTSIHVTGLFRSADGKLWAAGRGFFRFQPDAPQNEPAFERVAAPLLRTLLTGAVAEDAEGNLWASGIGAMKVTRNGFTTFSTADGLRSLNFAALTHDRDGDVCAIAESDGKLRMHFFDGSRFVPVDLYLPAGFQNAWGSSEITFQDHAREWWSPTAYGLLRFAAPVNRRDLAHTPPKRIYTLRDGLPNDVVLLLFEDSREDVWIGLYRGLARWNRRTDRIQAFDQADGLPLVSERPASIGSPLFFAEDRRGVIWSGFYPYGLARFEGGKFRMYTESDGLPKGQINWIYSDHLGRLWIASSQGGVARIDDVAAAKPSFRIYSIEQGLSSNQIYTIGEDRAGRIYLGGGRGADRLDPDSGKVRHFTEADGLPPVRVNYILRDRDGAVWFGSGMGLSRYFPEPDRTMRPQDPLIRRLRIAGNSMPIAELGESKVSGLRLGPGQDNLAIEFGSLNFRSGEVLRYQFRLGGTGTDWSPPTDHRAVTYANLPPGTYAFEVRAINGDGLSSARTATIGFVIVPPLWRRPWAIALEMLVLAILIWLAHYLRLRQLLHVERLRTRLASDLHDDIGSGLAEIAILSEVAAAQPDSATQVAGRTGERARQLRESMSDIVWSVDPHQRSLADLASRIRQSAYSMLESSDRRVEFEAPDERGAAEIPLSPECARQALLICREAMTNVARHSGASDVSIRLDFRRTDREPGLLIVEIRDNGRGFDAQSAYTGMGLRSLRRRASEAGGELTVDSSPGKGARLTARLPLG